MNQWIKTGMREINRMNFSSFDLVLEGIVETEKYPHYSKVSGKSLDAETPLKTGEKAEVIIRF